ncbi:DUF2945 domain-containing protein [Streptomyces sp. B1866]|uniref:DUF2945 domain-containing protein n=1 Tax=Streptomyces sp. B1866 TaxID=3075431 RepID=UPI00288CE380|nr:DUF2945 domain-containing protein [Streptomyces sp. B1866]MDT3397708.1 DUF2945 domain-containing protein [Streptomyces sp. B1866]
MSKDKQLRRGDKVTWRIHGSTALGTVVRKITERTRAGGRTVDASREKPQYEVESAKSGKRAVHRPQVLHKKGDRRS